MISDMLTEYRNSQVMAVGHKKPEISLQINSTNQPKIFIVDIFVENLNIFDFPFLERLQLLTKTLESKDNLTRTYVTAFAVDHRNKYIKVKTDAYEAIEEVSDEHDIHKKKLIREEISKADIFHYFNTRHMPAFWKIDKNFILRSKD